jgi:hypothetical protein
VNHLQKLSEHPLLASIEKETDILPINYMLGGIARFGTNARPAIPALIKIIESKRIMVADHALGALRKIDPEAAKPFIEQWKTGITNTPRATPPSDGQENRPE